MARKKWTIHGLEKALESVPEQERASVVAEIQDELSDFDPENPPGELVLPVPPGTRTCPSCSGTLVELGVMPHPDGDSVCILECEQCDEAFCEGPAALLQ